MILFFQSSIQGHRRPLYCSEIMFSCSKPHRISKTDPTIKIRPWTWWKIGRIRSRPGSEWSLIADSKTFLKGLDSQEEKKKRIILQNSLKTVDSQFFVSCSFVQVVKQKLLVTKFWRHTIHTMENFWAENWRSSSRRFNLCAVIFWEDTYPLTVGICQGPPSHEKNTDSNMAYFSYNIAKLEQNLNIA
jgi:hypothetical protein